MRTAPAALKTWLAANNVAWRADLVTIVLSDGVTKYRWTTADGNIAYGGNLFYAAGPNGPLVKRSAYNCAARLVIDTLDLELVGGGYTIAGSALPLLGAQGYFDGARVQIDHAIGSDPNAAIAGTGGGVIPSFFEGRIAGVEPKAMSLRMRLKSELVALNQLLPRFLLQHQCGNAVYDANCTMSRATFTLTGAASGVPTTTTVPTTTAALTAKASGYFNLGVLRFTQGPNNGLARAVQNWDGTTFTLALPFPSAPLAGNTFTVYPGCDRSKGRCLTVFNNLAHYRGFPHMPSPEAGSWYA